MQKTTDTVLPLVIDKGLVISTYKGEYHAKRIMMRAGLPVEVVNKVLAEKQTSHHAK